MRLYLLLAFGLYFGGFAFGEPVRVKNYSGTNVITTTNMLLTLPPGEWEMDYPHSDIHLKIQGGGTQIQFPLSEDYVRAIVVGEASMVSSTEGTDYGNFIKGLQLAGVCGFIGLGVRFLTMVGKPSPEL